MVNIGDKSLQRKSEFAGPRGPRLEAIIPYRCSGFSNMGSNVGEILKLAGPEEPTLEYRFYM